MTITATIGGIDAYYAREQGVWRYVDSDLLVTPIHHLQMYVRYDIPQAEVDLAARRLFDATQPDSNRTLGVSLVGR